MKTIWFNARFLDRSITGVERVAYEILSALSTDHLDKHGGCKVNGKSVQIKLITTTKSKAVSPWNNIELVKKGALQGHFWEQFELPRYTSGDLLLSLCNTGPLFKRMHISFLHDAQTFAIPKNFSFGFRIWYRIMFWCTANFSKQILVNSNFTLKELSKYLGIDKDNFKLCRFGTEHIKRNTETADLSKFKLPKEPYLLAVSSANPNKNFSGVIQAINVLGSKAPPCVIVGQMQQSHFADIKVDNSKIQHLGYVTDAELIALYKNALVLAYPSYYEGFGIPPLEAMSHGCPVIVSNASALPETVGDAGLYCNPSDAESIAEAIEKICTNNSLRKQLIEAGKERSKSFTWKNAALDVLSAIEFAYTKIEKYTPVKMNQ